MNKPKIAIGTISTGGIGTQSVTIGGATSPFLNAPANATKNEGDSALILMVDDDTPIIIGDPGYSIGG